MALRSVLDLSPDLDVLLGNTPAAARVIRLLSSHPRLPDLTLLPTPVPASVPTHRRAKWLITRAFNIKPRRGRRAEELRRVLAELDRYLRFWQDETKEERSHYYYFQMAVPDGVFTRRGVPLVGDRLLVHWAIEVLVSMSRWAP